MPTENISRLVDSLAALPGSERLTNPYSASGGHESGIRRANLIRYLEDMDKRGTKTLLLFEAPGYRGCALTGIPVTSERIMLRGISRWQLFGPGYQQVSSYPLGVSEMTATILWDTLVKYCAEPPLIWNTVPLHPHRPGNPESNRTPAAGERRMGLFFISWVCRLFVFKQIFAVGRVAQQALEAQGVGFIPLRHPSQGGKAAFVAGLRTALGK